MAFIDEMQNLRESIESGRRIRHRRIQEIKEELSAFRKDATKARKEDFQALSEKVNKFLADLKKDVASLKKEAKTSQKENRAKQRELKQMLSEAQAAFWGKKTKATSKQEKEGEKS